MARRGRHFVESAIDAVPDFKFVFEWFEMNVARPVLNRLEEDEIDEADDGGRIRVGLDFGDGCVVVPEGQEFAAAPSCLRMSSMLEVSEP